MSIYQYFVFTNHTEAVLFHDAIDRAFNKMPPKTVSGLQPRQDGLAWRYKFNFSNLYLICTMDWNTLTISGPYKVDPQTHLSIDPHNYSSLTPVQMDASDTTYDPIIP